MTCTGHTLQAELWCCLLLLMVLSTPIVCIEIVRHPENVTVFTNSEAEFTCEARNAASVGWKVNGTFLYQLDASLHADVLEAGSNGLYILTLTARAEYNGTVVQCVASVPGGAFAESENATLMIQGQLGAVGDVRVENNCGTILLSWSPPFSLDVTGMDPDIWYTVLISDVTDEDNPTAIHCSACHNLIETNNTITINPSPCHKYSFTIIPQNGAGEGNWSEPVEECFVCVPVQVDGIGVEVKWKTVEGRQIETLTLPEFNGCAVRRPDTFVVYCESMMDSECEDYRSNELVELDSTLTVNASSEELPNDCKWDVTIETINSNGRMNSTGTIIMSTFDVQDAYASAISGGVSITGRFSDSAQGWFITLSSVSSDLDAFLALPDTSGPAIVAGLDAGYYMVRIYDLEDGLPGKRPAVETVVVIREEGEDSTSTYSSSVLLSASIESTTNLKFTINCSFKPEVSKDSVCVVIWYQRSDRYLNTANYSMDEKFPIAISVNEGEYYIAIFGKGEVIDREPLLTKRVFFSRTTQDTPQLNPDEPQLNLVSIVASCVGGGISIVLVVVVFVTILVIIRQRKELRRAMMFSSHDPCTQPNLAYELHKPKRRTISMQQNIAYEQCTPPEVHQTMK